MPCNSPSFHRFAPQGGASLWLHHALRQHRVRHLHETGDVGAVHIAHAAISMFAVAQAGGMDLSVLAWALSMGTDIGGCGTPIGASANVVGISVAAKNGHFIGWGKYCRYAAPATVLVIMISMVCIYVRYF